MESSTRSWNIAIICVDDDEPVWMSGSDLRDEGYCTNARVFLEVCPEGGEVLVLFLEKSDNVAVFEVVL